eukprot:1802880-Amphidinium_carterae.1
MYRHDCRMNFEGAISNNMCRHGRQTAENAHQLKQTPVANTHRIHRKSRENPRGEQRRCTNSKDREDRSQDKDQTGARKE